MEFHFLGTGAGVPAKQRNVSSLAIRFLQNKGEVWLFDCGEATQHQLLRSPLTLTSISTIFITHLHGDHLLGLPGCVVDPFKGPKTTVTLYGPVGLKEFVDVTLRTTKTQLRYDLIIEELKPGLLFKTKQHDVHVLPLSHLCLPLRFVYEADQPGRLHAEKLKELGVAPGPLYAQLKLGKSVTLNNGQVIDGTAYMDEPIRGRTIVVAGDTAPVEAMKEFAFQADVLVHEATFARISKNKAHDFGHSTIADASSLAKSAEVKQLILTHVSSRYAKDETVYYAEVDQCFPGAFVARDMSILKLSKASELIHV
ncbi:LOW QUALITY PROTEIN: ribonuclease Z [Bacillus sp. JCM 19046]|nr:LOW QUALITY PROTEIN: ribonuclease Z [Bacillus sp. JCM 19046]